MRHYELVVVLSPMISPDEASQAWERIKGFITNREADIVHEERWGTRRLAYPVKKGQYQFLEGNYHLTRFATEGSFNRELENFLRLDENVLRSLVTVTLTEEELAAHAAQTRAPRPPRAPAGMPPAGGPQGAPQAAPAERPAGEAAAAPQGTSAPGGVPPAVTAEAPASSGEAAATTVETPAADAPAPVGEGAPATAEAPADAEEAPAAEEATPAEPAPPAEQPETEQPSE